MIIQNYSDNILLVELPPEPQLKDSLDDAMERLAQEADYDVAVDFSRIDILTSLSLSRLLQLSQLLSNTGRCLVFFNVAPLTREIFNVTCFEGIFKYADSLPTAAQILDECRVAAQ